MAKTSMPSCRMAPAAGGRNPKAAAPHRDKTQAIPSQAAWVAAGRTRDAHGLPEPVDTVHREDHVRSFDDAVAPRAASATPTDAAAASAGRR